MQPQMSIVTAELAPALEPQMRGAIISKPRQVNDPSTGTSVTIGGGPPRSFNRDAIVAALLFFDQVDCPENNFVAGSPTKPFGLPDKALWYSSRMILGGMMTANFEQVALLGAFERLNVRDKGRWALLRADDLAGLSPAAFGEMSAFQVSLQNALLMPSRSVSYVDILSYKERRYAELVALRDHMETIALQVDTQGFGGLAESKAFEKFITSINDFYKSMRETNFKKCRASLAAKFSIKNFAQSMALSMPFTHSLDGLISSIFGAAGGAIEFEMTKDLKAMSELKAKPFEYIYRAEAEI